ncbi:hypothetical protein Agub_g16043, partial [Astrephomene gubernaculifera]
MLVSGPQVRPAASARVTNRSSRCVVRARASAEYETLRGKTVYKASSGEPVELLSLWDASSGSKAVIPFLTHFADLSSWEYAQQLLKLLPTLEASDVRVLVVGLGSVGNAQAFSRALSFPPSRLLACPSPDLYRALGFSPGLAPDLPLSPALKLLPMLAGLGSPGTLQEVLRGYTGDPSAPALFPSPSPFDLLGGPGALRPMELATRRLFNMGGILPAWGDLAPPDPRLLTQQGGTLVFSGTSLLLKHVDSGILRYADPRVVMQAALGAEFR